MPESKKEWVVIHFPQGPFPGTVNVAIKGEWVVDAQTAKEMMSTLQENDVLTTDK